MISGFLVLTSLVGITPWSAPLLAFVLECVVILVMMGRGA